MKIIVSLYFPATVTIQKIQKQNLAEILLRAALLVNPTLGTESSSLPSPCFSNVFICCFSEDFIHWHEPLPKQLCLLVIDEDKNWKKKEIER